MNKVHILNGLFFGGLVLIVIGFAMLFGPLAVLLLGIGATGTAAAIGYHDAKKDEPQ